MAEPQSGGIRVRFVSVGKDHECLCNRKSHFVGARHDGRLDDSRMLDKHTFEFERADPIIRGFKDVVQSADVRQKAIAIANSDIARMIEATPHGACVELQVVDIFAQERARIALHVNAYLTLFALLSVVIEKYDRSSGKRPTH